MTFSLITLLDILNICGTIAFAASGAIVAMQKRFDIFGVLFLSCITAVWGGVMRDIILGLTPPVAFVQPLAPAIALLTGIVAFLAAGEIMRRGQDLIFVTDAVGLGVFAAVGASRAIVMPECNLFLVVVTAMLTGIGGGMLRDLLAGETPFVLRRKEVYATACICGALIFYLSYPYIGDIGASYACFASTTAIRIFSKWRKIYLPKASLKNEKRNLPLK